MYIFYLLLIYLIIENDVFEVGQIPTTLKTGGSETLVCQTTSMTTSAPLPQMARVGRSWEWSVCVMKRVPTGEPFLLNNATDMSTSNTSISTPTTSPARPGDRSPVTPGDRSPVIQGHRLPVIQGHRSPVTLGKYT